jgi:hypothetical protein
VPLDDSDQSMKALDVNDWFLIFFKLCIASNASVYAVVAIVVVIKQ